MEDLTLKDVGILAAFVLFGLAVALWSLSEYNLF